MQFDFYLPKWILLFLGNRTVFNVTPWDSWKVQRTNLILGKNEISNTVTLCHTSKPDDPVNWKFLSITIFKIWSKKRRKFVQEALIFGNRSETCSDYQQYIGTSFRYTCMYIILNCVKIHVQCTFLYLYMTHVVSFC